MIVVNDGIGLEVVGWEELEVHTWRQEMRIWEGDERPWTVFVYKENQRYRSCVGRGWRWPCVVTDRSCLSPWCFLVPSCGLSGMSRLPLITARPTCPKCAFSFTFSGAKYSLLAYTTLGLESAEDNFRTHNLTITGNGKYIWYQFKEIKNQ